MSESLHFTGIFIPDEICELVRLKTVTPTEVFLLGIIRAFSRKDICWASNEEIGKKCGLSLRSVSLSIAKLKGLKLLKISQKDRRRTIRTVLSLGPLGPKDRAQCLAQKMKARSAMPCAPSSLSLYGTHIAQESQRQEGAGAPCVNSAGGSMPFRTVKPKTKVTEFDLAQADLLREAVVLILKLKKEGWFRLRQSWANEFRILRQALEQGEDRISSVMKWYLEHCHEKGFKPVISGAKHFRSAFSWLERLATAEQRKRVVVSEQAKTILKRLKMMRWPKDSKEDLGAAVQASLDSLSEFRRGLMKVRDHLQKSSDESTKRFIASVSARTGHPENFVENWFSDVWASVKNWDDWNGDIMSKAFDYQGEKFKKMGKGWASAWGSVKLWDKLMERINGTDQG